MRFGNPTNLRGHYEWIFPQDDAFDWKRKADKEAGTPGFREAYAEYLDTGSQTVLAPFVVSGHAPAIFTLRQLTSKQKRYVADTSSREGGTQAAYEAVRLAMVSIATPGVDPPELEFEIDRHGWDVLADDSMELFDLVSPVLINTIGLHVISRTVPSKN